MMSSDKYRDTKTSNFAENKDVGSVFLYPVNLKEIYFYILELSKAVTRLFLREVIPYGDDWTQIALLIRGRPLVCHMK